MRSAEWRCRSITEATTMEQMHELASVIRQRFGIETKAIDDLLSATSVPEESLNPVSETDRKTAASSIAAMAEETIGPISQFMWDTAVLRIGQLASEMCVSIRGQSVGGSNGRSAQRDACPSKNADELTNWDGTKKKGLGW